MPAGNYNTQTTTISGDGFARSLPDGAATTGNTINTGSSLCTTQVDRVSSTTLTNITGLTANVVGGGTYLFEAYVPGTATANGGAKFAIGGTATATTCSYTGTNLNGATNNATTTTTTLGNAVGAATAVLTYALIRGAIVVNAGGTLTVQIAQNASHADTTSAYVNGYFTVVRVS